MKSTLARAVVGKIHAEKTTQEGYAKSVGLSQATLSRIIDGAIPSGVPLIRILSSFDVDERQEILESLVAEHSESGKDKATIPEEVLRIINTFTEELHEIGVYHEQTLAFFRVFLLEVFNRHHQQDESKEPGNRSERAAQNLAELTSELASYDSHQCEEYIRILIRMTEHIKGIQS